MTEHDKNIIKVIIGLIIFVGIVSTLFMITSSAKTISNGAQTTNLLGSSGLQELTLNVQIPCPGHASLITGELKKLAGVQEVKFRFPNYFDVKYDSRTNPEQILSLNIFNEFPASTI